MNRSASSGSAPSHSLGSLARRGVALAVLLVAAWLLLKVVLSVAVAVAWTVVTILAIVAVIWALRVLL